MVQRSEEGSHDDTARQRRHNGRMLLGLQVSDFTWPDSPDGIGPTFARIARDAEATGFASLWVMDHFFQIEMIGPPQHEMLEAYSALAFAAAATSRVSLGTLVTGVTYRHPGVLLKTVTTLDVLSGGRAYLGIGAAWNEEEHRGLGVAYPALSERFERLEETLQIAERMFTGDESPFHGKHYQLERPLNSPAPVSSPRPRILVGGSGEKKGLRLVAQYADACNIFEMPIDAIAQQSTCSVGTARRSVVTTTASSAPRLAASRCRATAATEVRPSSRPSSGSPHSRRSGSTTRS